MHVWRLEFWPRNPHKCQVGIAINRNSRLGRWATGDLQSKLVSKIVNIGGPWVWLTDSTNKMKELMEDDSWHKLRTSTHKWTHTYNHKWPHTCEYTYTHIWKWKRNVQESMWKRKAPETLSQLNISIEKWCPSHIMMDHSILYDFTSGWEQMLSMIVVSRQWNLRPKLWRHLRLPVAPTAMRNTNSSCK